MQEEVERSALGMFVVHEASLLRRGRGAFFDGELQGRMPGVVGVEGSFFDDQAAGRSSVGLRHADVEEDDYAPFSHLDGIGVLHHDDDPFGREHLFLCDWVDSGDEDDFDSKEVSFHQ